MLVKAEIINYQSHKETIVEFIPGTNVIIGETDTGKSAIFRAINWVASNRPLGDDFRSEWGGDTKVALYTTEGNVIERIRSASENKYVINGQEIKAFGTEVPEEVSAMLQLDSASIQPQRDPAFLLADSPGEAARRLNKAASIDDIDYTISNLKSTYTNLKNDIKFNDIKLSEHKEQIKQYEDIPALEDILSQVEAQEKERQEHQRRLERLKVLTLRVGRVEEELQQTENIPTLLKKQAEVQEKYNAFQEKEKTLNQLKQIVRQAEKAQKYLQSTVYVENALILSQETYDKYLEAQQLQRKGVSLILLVKDINEKTRSINILQKELDYLEQKFHELSPETCPLCGNPMGGV